MPVIKSAKKKLRKDKKRTNHNAKVRMELKTLLKKATKEKSPELVQRVFTAADRAAKQNIIHKNKAARLKSRIAKLLNTTVVKTQKPPVKKTSSKKTK